MRSLLSWSWWYAGRSAFKKRGGTRAARGPGAVGGLDSLGTGGHHPPVDEVDIEGRITRVTSLEDERVADYRDLREADLAARRQAFIAESEVVLRVLLARGRFAVRSIFVAASRLPKLAALLALVDPSVPIFVGEQGLLNQVVGFRIHRGILAAGERGPVPTAAQLCEQLGAGPRRLVLLEGLTNHDNVGGVFRNAAAFGVDGVLYDGTTCDPLYRKAIRVSVGAALFVPFGRCATSEEAIEAARGADFEVLALSPSPDGDDLAELGRRWSCADRAALLVGSEGPGLTPATLAAADRVVRIAMAEGFDSLNVATATGIALHALRTSQLPLRSGPGG
ncbi:MAG: RNA methyltransferase [Deltaproteobacteria bacterium]|nr:RNA methyltransferase [Deltaproteobacteria bacterium]